jgi:hypothetical protein
MESCATEPSMWSTGNIGYMPVKFWTVQRQNVSPAIDPRRGIETGGAIVASLDTAMGQFCAPDSPGWKFERNGEPVTDLAEFRQLSGTSADTHPGEFVARHYASGSGLLPDVVVESA